jgi:hypothetical protein
MVEILWKTDAPRCRPEEQEYFELRLVDLGIDVKSRFVVREIRSRWSDKAREVVWEGHEDDNCRTPEEAQQCYANRRAAIVANGFKSSAELGLSKAS